jgi:hypothetical protein
MRIRPGRAISLLALMPVAMLACGSDSSVTPPGPEPPPVWSEVTNLIPTLTLYAMWAPRPDYIVGAGSDGQIWQWDGQQWSARVSGVSDNLYAIDGSTQGKVVVVGDAGTVLEQVNGAFVRRNSGTTEQLHSVWRSPSGEFLASGDYGTIVRGDGTTWSEDSTATRTALLCVWGSRDDDVFAVGVDGAILHYNGTAWSSMSSPTTEFLTSVNGTSASDVYAVGAAGTILHYDGNAWSAIPSHTTDLLQSVCAGCGPVAVGANGTIVRMHNGVFAGETIPGTPWLYAVAHAGNDTWAVGARALLRYDGAGWKAQTRGTIPVLRALTSTPAEGLVAAGDNGNVMLDGPTHWRFEDAGALQRLNAVWTSPAGEIFAAGTNRIFRRTNTGWVVENSDVVEYFDIAGNSRHIFAVGRNGEVRERVGSTWGKVFTTGVAGDLHAVNMTETGGLMAGSPAVILYYDNYNWVVEYTGSPTSALWDIAPVETPQYRAMAVGSGGLILGLSIDDRTGWTPIQSPTTSTLYSLVRGPGGYLFAVGAGGTVLRFVNEKWDAVQVPTTRTFLKAWSQGGTLFVCGGNDAAGGILFRYGPPSP